MITQYISKTTITSPKIGSASYKAHERVAHEICTQYLIDLARSKWDDFGTLESLIETFWIDLAGCVRQQASKRGAHRINVCRATLTSLAHSEIRSNLAIRPSFAAKLKHIRAAQAAKAKVAIAA